MKRALLVLVLCGIAIAVSQIGIAAPVPLTVTCPKPIVDTTTDAAGKMETFTAVATGGRGGKTITYSPKSGSVFPVAVTTVTVTASSKFDPAATCRFTVTLTLAASPPPPPPPPTTSAAGPASNITCPAGAVDVLSGMDIPLVVDAHAAGTSFCVHAWTYLPTRPIYLRAGTVFTCEYGAAIDGTNVMQSYDVGGINIISGWNTGQDNVTVRNCIVRNQLRGCIGTTGTGWIIDHNDISGCWFGVNLNFSHNDLISNNYIHHNGTNVSDSVHVNGGGGFAAFMSTDIVYDSNEIAYNTGGSHPNGPAQKSIDSWRITYQNNFVHHNTTTALWCDGCDGWAIYGVAQTSANGCNLWDGNRVEDNAGIGIMVEITPCAVVRNNVIRRNGADGIFISSSHNADVYGNDLTDNWRGIELFVYCDGIAGWPTRAFDLANNTVHDNTVRLTTSAPAGWLGTDGGQRAMLGSLGYTGCTSTQAAPYISNAKGNVFSRNTYLAPNVNQYWYWPSNWMTFAQWQAIPQDSGSTVN